MTTRRSARRSRAALPPATGPAVALLLAVLVLPGAVAAATIWDESLQGDLSSTAATPTTLAFGTGSNIIAGTVQATGDTRDFITFTLAPDQALSALLLLTYQGETPEVPGNLGYHAINSGNRSFLPSTANGSSFLGGDHVDGTLVATDLLPRLATATLAGTGFTAPLGPGTYSYLIQQTGPDFTRYALDFQVTPVPVPAALPLLGSALGLLAGLRGRRGRA